MRIKRLLSFVLLGLVLIVGAGLALSWCPDLPTDEVDAAYASADSRFVELADGTRIHYLDSSAKDVASAASGTRSSDAMPAPTADSRQVLILIHGSFDSVFTWEEVLPELRKSFRVLALDLPAHGLTGRTSSGRYAMQDMVDALHAWTVALGLSRFVLAGNSMGGHTAWRYALAHPERVEKLILIDSAGYPVDTAPLVEAEPNPVMTWVYRNLDPTLFVRRGLARSVADPNDIRPREVERAVAFLRRAGSREAQAARNRQRSAPVFERIRELQTPTLILWGDRDALLPVGLAQRFDEDLPNSRLEIYSGIGHRPQLESPERVVADIRAFAWTAPESESAAR